MPLNRARNTPAIPGSPAFVSKAASYKRTTAGYGLANVDLQGSNAIQGYFKFEH